MILRYLVCSERPQVLLNADPQGEQDSVLPVTLPDHSVLTKFPTSLEQKSVDVAGIVRLAAEEEGTFFNRFGPVPRTYRPRTASSPKRLRPSRRPALPKDLPKAITYLADEELD
jgi:hypothetical protein